MSTEISEAMKKKEPTCSDNLTMPMIFDLIGPFAVHVEDPKKRQAIIYAPLCEDHHANLLTDAQDISLPGSALPPSPPFGTEPKPTVHQRHYIYCLTGPIASDCAQYDPERPRELLRVHRSGSLDAEAAGKYHLKMIVPLPDKIVSLRPEQVWIHRNGSDVWLTKLCKDQLKEPNVGHVSETEKVAHDPDNIVNRHRARGLRFIYYDCATPEVTLDGMGGTEVPGLSDLCAVTRGLVFGGVIAPHYSMTLRYAALHSASEVADPDDSYADAYSCFEHLRNLVPGLPDWRVDFNNAPSSSLHDSYSGSNPHDCLSPNVIVQNEDDPA